MKGNKIAMAIVAIAAVLLLAAALLLFQGISQFRDVSVQLNASRHQLGSLYQRNPFPSEENIARERQHLEELRREFTALRADLAEGQVEPVRTAPSRFIEMFRETSRRLAETAAKHGTALAPELAFGFARHRAGELPNAADVPRLIQQLSIVEQLVNVLYDAGVENIIAVNRQEFEVRDAPEKPGTAPAGGGLWGTSTPSTPRDTTPREPPTRVGLLEGDADYASMRFSLEFTLRENILPEVLNAFASHPMFIVVTSVDLKNSFTWRPARTAPGSETGRETTTVIVNESVPRGDRVATGITKNPLHVKIDLKVYRFRKDNQS